MLAAGAAKAAAKLIEPGHAAAAWLPLAELVPWKRNPRKNDAAVPRVRASIIRYGWGRALVARAQDRQLVIGHTARLAALSLPGAWEEATPAARERWHPEALVTLRQGLVPVRLKALGKPEAEALAIADNRLGEIAVWDDPLVLRLLRAIDEEERLVVGYDEQDLARLVAAVHGQSEAPPAPVVAGAPKRAALGDLWILGRHRLMCGDCTVAVDVARLLEDARPDLLVTDPPWGVLYDAAWRASTWSNPDPATKRTQKIVNDDVKRWLPAWQLAPCSVAYVWHADQCVVETGLDLRAAGFELRHPIVWAKPHFPIGRGHYHQRHELAWYGVRKGAKSHWIGDRKQNTVWETSLDASVAGGPSSQKPVELMAKAIRNHRGDVYDPFAGSGPTLIACEQLERRCFAMDLDPRCVDAVIARWEQATGGKASKA